MGLSVVRNKNMGLELDNLLHFNLMVLHLLFSVPETLCSDIFPQLVIQGSAQILLL